MCLVVCLCMFACVCACMPDGDCMIRLVLFVIIFAYISFFTSSRLMRHDIESFLSKSVLTSLQASDLIYFPYPFTRRGCYIVDWQNYVRSMHIVCHGWMDFLLSSIWFVLVVLPDMHVFNLSLALRIKSTRTLYLYVLPYECTSELRHILYFEFATQLKSRMTHLNYRNLLLAC